MNILDKLSISGKIVLPIIEGGKGIGVSNGETAGAFAAAGAVGTFSGVFPQVIDDNGEIIPLIFKGKNRKERFEEIIDHCIKGCISQAQIASDIAKGNGRIHINILWGMAGAERILNGVMESAKDKIHGITCGAGMPYKLADIAEKYKTYYYPIVSSTRAFRALWMRSYNKFSDLLGGVVYEDPWKAGGHTGLTQKDNPDVEEDPFHRVREIRQYMNKVGLEKTPIIIAGGVWYLNKFKDLIDNIEIGPIAFQFGTRPMLTQESPISTRWKEKLFSLTRKDVTLNKFSPTGFYSSAVNNEFLIELKERSKRQIDFRNESDSEFNTAISLKSDAKPIYVKSIDTNRIDEWKSNGFSVGLKTPDSTIVFVSSEKATQIRDDQRNCKGCLAGCKFSSWMQSPETNYSTGEIPDPRSYCIQGTLQNIIQDDNIDNQLMFSGSNVFNFSKDSLFSKGYIPTIKEMIQRILNGK
ncbi:MAG: nitronate monooxygenase [Candidatus Marinimicrobia bacterium]|nr:nitronate monooxygenase [Candidatus Neomarinimicrobiota bacterium]MBL7109384.1 nitronate monooxygenase [Candidatus Neomarinimicrobiota bacterium]